MDHRQADVAVTAVVAAVACGAAAVDAPTAVMAVLGIALFAAPGYLLGQLLIGSRSDGLECVVVATGLAFAVPILGGLLLYAAGVPLQRSSWLGLLAGVTLAADAVLYLRRRLHRAAFFSWPPGWRVRGRHAGVFAAAVMVAACGVALARVSVKIQPQPGFTQLWLSPHGNDAHTASLGVSNDQGSPERYRLVLTRNGLASATWNLALADGQTWQQTVPFTGTYTLAANLYRLPDLTHPYRYVTTNGSQGAGS